MSEEGEVATEVIGRVKAGKTVGKTYEVKWDPHSRSVYVSYGGWTACGKATTAGEAMRKAEAYVYDK